MFFDKPASGGMNPLVTEHLQTAQDWTQTFTSLRKGPTGVGLTFETLTGIKENNNPGPDLHCAEMKAKRIDENNLLTMGCKNPCHPRKPDDEPGKKLRGGLIRSLTKEYGEVAFHEEGDMRRGLYHTIRNHYETDKQLWRVEDSPEGMLLIWKATEKVVGIWTKEMFNDFIGKATNLCLIDVKARKLKDQFWIETNKKGKIIQTPKEEFTFLGFTYYCGFNPQKLYEMILAGEAFVDLRAHLKLDGNGDPIKVKAMRDHGTAFRIAPEKLALCYDSYKEMPLVVEK